MNVANTFSSFVASSIVVAFIYVNGMVYFMGDFERDKCEVTYMFEYPQYVRISNKADETYPKYELYAYSEGRFTERARQMYFDGIPILFIPGNAGSHRQVRSLSSVALRKAINSRTSFHLDYFSVNLNTENSALTGAFLFDQLDYVNASIHRILELYKDRKNPPKSVAVIGHSMGGIVAKRLAALQPNLIRIVLLLAGPIKRALYLLDYHMETFYKTVPPISSINSTTLISLSGGFSDQMLLPSLYELPRKNSNALSLVTSTIPMSWLQANHIQILWCKQIILAINRAFFDSVDIRTGQISDDNDVRIAAFEHHLVRDSGIKFHQRHLYDKAAKFDYHKGEWIELIEKQKTIAFKLGVHEPKYFMVRMAHFNEYQMVTLLAINLDVVDWVFACGAHVGSRSYRACAQGQHLTHHSEIAPSKKYKRRIIHVNMHDLMETNTNLTHVMFRALPTTEPLAFYADTYAQSDRTVMVALPSFFKITTRPTTIIEATAPKAIYYKLNLPDLTHIIQAYKLQVNAYDCSDETYHHAVATLVVPWSNEDTHAYTTETFAETLVLRLYNSKPQNSQYDPPYVKLTLDPTCRYHVNVKLSFDGMLGQLARNYSYLMLAFMSSVILMAFRLQLQTIGNAGQCPSFFSALKQGAKPYYVLTGFKLLSRAFGTPFFLKFLPEPDWKFLVDDGSDFLILPLVLYVTSLGLVYLFVTVFYVALITMESSVNKVALRFLAKTVSFTFSFSDHLMTVVHKLPFLVSGFLVFLSLTTCGSLALCVGAFFYFLRLTQMSQEFFEQVISHIIKWAFSETRRIIKSRGGTLDQNRTNPTERDNDDDRLVQANESPSAGTEEISDLNPHTEICFHASIFFMWLIVTVLNVPCVITWAHNFHESKTLQNDTSLFPGLVLSLCAFPLWQFQLPRTNLAGYERLSQLMWMAAVIVLIYTPITLYRLNYLLAIVIAIVTVHQLGAPAGSNAELVNEEEEEAEDRKGDASKTKYDEAKAKMD